jgi:uridine nucleosidase
MPRKVIIDTDPGVDDTMAIYFALKSPELELIGLTTIFGNVTTELATTNALRLMEIAGRTDIPVAKGSDDPIAVPYSGAVPFVHGDDGQGNVHLPPPTTQAVDQSAAQFIVEQIMSQPGEVTLIPVGPLTNIALALRLEPRIAQNVKEVVVMGGNALGPGNASPAAEANIRNDPEAADVVFGGGVAGDDGRAGCDPPRLYERRASGGIRQDQRPADTAYRPHRAVLPQFFQPAYEVGWHLHPRFVSGGLCD